METGVNRRQFLRASGAATAGFLAWAKLGVPFGLTESVYAEPTHETLDPTSLKTIHINDLVFLPDYVQFSVYSDENGHLNYRDDWDGMSNNLLVPSLQQIENWCEKYYPSAGPDQITNIHQGFQLSRQIVMQNYCLGVQDYSLPKDDDDVRRNNNTFVAGCTQTALHIWEDSAPLKQIEPAIEAIANPTDHTTPTYDALNVVPSTAPNEAFITIHPFNYCDDPEVNNVLKEISNTPEDKTYAIGLLNNITRVQTSDWVTDEQLANRRKLMQDIADYIADPTVEPNQSWFDAMEMVGQTTTSNFSKIAGNEAWQRVFFDKTETYRDFEHIESYPANQGALIAVRKFINTAFVTKLDESMGRAQLDFGEDTEEISKILNALSFVGTFDIEDQNSSNPATFENNKKASLALAGLVYDIAFEILEQNPVVGAANFALTIEGTLGNALLKRLLERVRSDAEVEVRAMHPIVEHTDYMRDLLRVYSDHYNLSMVKTMEVGHYPSNTSAVANFNYEGRMRYRFGNGSSFHSIARSFIHETGHAFDAERASRMLQSETSYSARAIVLRELVMNNAFLAGNIYHHDAHAMAKGVGRIGAYDYQQNAIEEFETLSRFSGGTPEQTIENILEYHRKVVLGVKDVDEQSLSVEERTAMRKVLRSYNAELKHRYLGGKGSNKNDMRMTPHVFIQTRWGDYLTLATEMYELTDNEMRRIPLQAKLALTEHYLIELQLSGGIDAIDDEDIAKLLQQGTDLTTILLTLQENINSYSPGHFNPLSMNGMAFLIASMGYDNGQPGNLELRTGFAKETNYSPICFMIAREAKNLIQLYNTRRIDDETRNTYFRTIAEAIDRIGGDRSQILANARALLGDCMKDIPERPFVDMNYGETIQQSFDWYFDQLMAV